MSTVAFWVLFIFMSYIRPRSTIPRFISGSVTLFSSFQKGSVRFDAGRG